MYTNITGETPIAALTVSQFVELLEKSKTLNRLNESR